MRDGIDEEREPEDVGEKYEFVSLCGADLPYGDEEVETGEPFVKGEPSFTGEVVEVGDEPFEDVFETWVGALRVDSVHVFGDVFYGEVFEDGYG